MKQYNCTDHIYSLKKGITLYSSFNKNLKGDKSQTIFEDSEGDEWVLTDKGISIVGKKQIDIDFPFHRIKEVEGVIYLISQTDKLASFDLHTKKLKFIEVPYSYSTIHEVKSCHWLLKKG